MPTYPLAYPLRSRNPSCCRPAETEIGQHLYSQLKIPGTAPQPPHIINRGEFAAQGKNNEFPEVSSPLHEPDRVSARTQSHTNASTTKQAAAGPAVVPSAKARSSTKQDQLRQSQNARHVSHHEFEASVLSRLTGYSLEGAQDGEGCITQAFVAGDAIDAIMAMEIANHDSTCSTSSSENSDVSPAFKRAGQDSLGSGSQCTSRTSESDDGDMISPDRVPQISVSKLLPQDSQETQQSDSSDSHPLASDHLQSSSVARASTTTSANECCFGNGLDEAVCEDHESDHDSPPSDHDPGLDFLQHPGHKYWEWDRGEQNWRRKDKAPDDEGYWFPREFA